jgi:hypothetical protein
MRRIAKSLLLLVLLLPAAWPQATTGTVSGTVRDLSGAVIPNADVVITNTETNVTSRSRTTDAGVYFYPGVMAGPYRLTVEFAGMQKYEGRFTVQVSQSVTVDPVLHPGATATTVDVQDVTPLVTTDNPTMRSSMDHIRLEQLPINGRSMSTLMATVPGYEGSGRVFGTPSDGREWILDGAVVTDRRWAGDPMTQPALDSIQEFSVQANAISAKLSRPVSLIMTVKNGTNAFHGTAFETNRNNGIGLARARTDNYTTPPKLIRNEYGASAGGPVILPKYNGKNRTFWFFNFEGQQNRSASTASFNVPTAAMRNGDFSGALDSLGRLQVIYDPLSTGAAGIRTPFAYGGKANVIDPSRQNALAKYLFGITPMPTNGANPLLDVNWFGPANNSTSKWGITGRVDQRFTDNDQVHVVFTDNYWWNMFPTNSGGVGQQMLNDVAGSEYDTNGMKSIAGTWTHVLSPSTFNELLVSVKRNEFVGGEHETGTNWADKFGLPNPFHTDRWLQAGSLGLGNYVFLTNDTKKNYDTAYVVDDNVTKIHGRHELLFGIHARRDLLNDLPQQRFPAPQLSYATLATALLDKASSATAPAAAPQTGFNLANMFLGYPTYNNNLSHSWYYLTGGELATYFQDNFKIAPRLTLNLGLRWEYWPPFHDKRGSITGFSPEKRAVVLGNSLDQLYALGATYPALINTYKSFGMNFISPSEAGLPQDGVDSRKANFGPRAGFAYRALDGKRAFVLRGGYSLSYFHINLAQWLDNNRQNYPLAAGFGYNPNDATQSPDGISNYWLRTAPSVIAGVNSANVVRLDQVTGINRGSGTLTYFAPKMPEARVHTWNLTAEKEIFANTVFRARYLGNHASNLGITYTFNQTTPSYIWYASTLNPLPTGAYANVATRFYDQTTFGNLQEYRQIGWTNNNGFQLELEHRFEHGYAYQLSYTMTNSLIAGAVGSSAPTLPEVNQFLPGAVPTDAGQRLRFLNYQRDTAVPHHRVKWNWLVDLPFGKGRWLGRNAGSVLDKFIGGWQVAGLGSLGSTYFTLPTGNWNFNGPVEQYGYKYPIQNCTSGVCVPGYLWWNGYIPSNLINSHDAKGNPNGYEGIPADYKPAATPLIPYGTTAMPANAPAGTNISTYWDTNTAWIKLNNNSVQRVTYDTGLNPWRNQYLPSVLQWGLDASVFKMVAISESVNLRLNADFFNVLNHPGNPNSVGADGFLNTRSSGQSPRTLQLSLRLNW